MRAFTRIATLGAALSYALPAGATGTVWALAEFSGGYALGPYHFEHEANPGFGVTGLLEFDETVRAPVLGAGGVLGYALPNGFAFGAGVDFTVLAFSGVRMGASDIGPGYLAAISLAAGFHPEDSGLTVRLGAGVAQSAFIYGQNDVGSADNVVDPEVMRGPIGSVAAGWLWGRIGVDVRIVSARLSSDHSHFHPVAITTGFLIETW